MINSLKPSSAQGHDDKKNEAIDKVMRQYGNDQKEREAVKKLGKDEFFKIMVTQIQHQDPLKPYQNEEMAAQLAQFTSLEQMVNMNNALERLTQSQQPLQQLGTANLIGKYVTADSRHVHHNEGKQTDLKFILPSDAAKAKIVILNEKGENVREIEAKNLKKGEATVNWDGKLSNEMPAATGNYIIQVVAEEDTGKSIPVQTQKTEVVHGIAFEGKDIVLLTGDVASPKKLFLKNVSKIIDPSAHAAKVSFNGENPGSMQTPQTSQIIDAIDKPEKPMENYTPGLMSKFSPIQIPGITNVAEKQKVPSSEEGSVAGKWKE